MKCHAKTRRALFVSHVIVLLKDKNLKQAGDKIAGNSMRDYAISCWKKLVSLMQIPSSTEILT
jgi:hypothetical protein